MARARRAWPQPGISGNGPEGGAAEAPPQYFCGT